MIFGAPPLARPSQWTGRMTDAETLPLTDARISFPQIDAEPEEVTLEERRSPFTETTYRYFAMDPGEDPAQAVLRLAHTVPELVGLRVETIGGEGGVHVLRSGDARAALDESLEPAEAVVRAANVLLCRAEQTFRFVPLRAGGAQGLYAAATAAESVELLNAGLLGVEGLADLFDLASF